MGNKQSLKAHTENAQRTGVFQMTNSKLQEVPQALFAVKTLRSIDLSNNKLKELPPAFGTFTALRTLLLNGNQLTSLPEEVCQLVKLETLSLAGKQAFIPFDSIRFDSPLYLTLNKHSLTKFARRQQPQLAAVGLLQFEVTADD